MIDFKKISSSCKDKTFCELLFSFYENKIVEVYCGDHSEETNFDQISVKKPGILVGTVIGAHKNMLILDANSQVHESIKKIVCIQESSIVMVTERDGSTLDNFFLPSKNTCKKNK